MRFLRHVFGAAAARRRRPHAHPQPPPPPPHCSEILAKRMRMGRRRREGWAPNLFNAPLLPFPSSSSSSPSRDSPTSAKGERLGEIERPLLFLAIWGREEESESLPRFISPAFLADRGDLSDPEFGRGAVRPVSYACWRHKAEVLQKHIRRTFGRTATAFYDKGRARLIETPFCGVYVVACMKNAHSKPSECNLFSLPPIRVLGLCCTFAVRVALYS